MLADETERRVDVREGSMMCRVEGKGNEWVVIGY